MTDIKEALAWQPIFGGGESLEIKALIDEIATEIPEKSVFFHERHGQASERVRRQLGASLAGGLAGISLLYGYRYLAFRDPFDRARMDELLDRAVDVLEDTPTTPGLASGFTGVGWAVAHLMRTLAISSNENPVEAVDLAMNLAISKASKHDEYDLISGLVGWAVYFIERLPSPTAVTNLGRVVDLLAADVDTADNTMAWYTPPERVPHSQLGEAPNGYYNLGVAHGIPGVLSILGTAYTVGFRDPRIPNIIRASSAWILKQPRPLTPNLRFANWIIPGKNPVSRFAWCYGDPGVLITLFGAAIAIEDETLAEQVLVIARQASDVTCDHPDVRDTGLCHGAAGVGHIFNRLYQATGEEPFADAARFWFRRTLQMRRIGMGISGLQSRMVDDDGVTTWITDASFLTGAAGTALALLASISTVEPSWDRLLLTSVQSRVRRAVTNVGA